ncbi:transposable element Tcb1 transposase [Trichonephila clavipes]|nr:transposable element Tcb1 transposase [Trichonephila clavipes]
MPGKRARRHFSQLSEFGRGLNCRLVDAPCCWPGVDCSEWAVRNCWEQWTRKGTLRAESRVWSDQEDHEERGSKDHTLQKHILNPSTLSEHSFQQWNIGHCVYSGAKPDQCGISQIGKRLWFSDESRFVLGTDDNRVRVWRRPGERYNSLHTVLRHTARTAGVMVWGTIANDSRSTLIVMRGTLTGQRYVDDILRPHVGLFPKMVSPGSIFQQDNASPHTARVAQDFLRHFQTLPWPAHSPDLSP